jgi:hypothetical protein
VNLNEVWTDQSADTIADGLIRDANQQFHADVKRAKDAYLQTDIQDYDLMVKVSVEFQYTPPERETAWSCGQMAEVEIKRVKLFGHDITEFLPEEVLDEIRDAFGHGVS